MLKPAPVVVAWVMVTLEPPVLVRVSDSVELLPICTLPKLRLDGFAPSAPAVTPVPERGMLSVGFEPLLMIARLPLTLPADDGANTTLKVLLCPAVRVKGKLRPLTLNPAPVAVACEIVTLEPPELVTVSDRVELLPICTLPKLRLEGFAVSDPAATPVPERGRFKVGFEASLRMAMLPVTGPCGLRREGDVKVCTLARSQCQRQAQAAQAEACASCGCL